MEINELTTRLVRRYWRVLLIALVLSAVAVGAYVAARPATYTAHARIVAAAATPKAQAEAAAVVSQVQAVATSRDVVAKALSDARLPRDPAGVAKAVVVTGLGTSSVVDIAYTDTSASMAQQVTNVLAAAVATTLDQVLFGGLPQVLQDIDNQLTSLADKRAPIAAAAQASPNDLNAQARLTSIDNFIATLTGNRDRLAEDAATSGHSTVIQTALRPPADSRGLSAKIGIGALLGLVLGLLMIGLTEIMHPAVSGATGVARLLDVPLLGAVSSDPVTLADIGRRLRLGARRAGVSTVVLLRADRSAVPPEAVDRIEAAALRPQPVASRVAVPIAAVELPIVGVGVADPDSSGGMLGSVAVLTVSDNGNRANRLRKVCALEELDPSFESERIGLVVLAGDHTELTAVDGVRDLATAAGWPTLGVLVESGQHGWGRFGLGLGRR